MNIAEMNFVLALLLLLLQYSSAQDRNCDFYQDVAVGTTYYVNNLEWPRNYRGGVNCRWIAVCPQGYNCQMDCPEISLPQSSSCSMDSLLLSRTGDPQLSGAERYCGLGSLTAKSTGQRISMGLITNRSSSGGRFQCKLTAQSATPTPQCRCGERRQERIVGGQETGINEYPMMAGLVDRSIVKIKCGAVIISKKGALTAAHCVQYKSVKDYALVVGEHNVTIGDSPATRAYRIANFTIHPLFTDSNYDNDIAIVTVAGKIEFNDRVRPVCLPFKFANNDFTGSKVTALGWGTLSFGGPTSNVLRKVDLDVISQNSCRAKVPSLTNRQMCTYTPGKDACQDDSGGPLLYTDPATGLLFHVGIISNGKSCASDQPAINARVTTLLNWIVTNTDNNSNYCRK